MKIVKRSVTLMEVLIAMVLTVLVLTTLTFFYQQVIVIGTQIDRSKEEEFYIRYVENRLSDVLPRILAPGDKNYAFFSLGDEGITKLGSQSLVFTFDNGVSMDKQVANSVVGRLYVDPEGRLILAYWPTPRRWDKTELPPMKKEILLSGIESMEFAFFVAPEYEPEKEKEAPKKDEGNKKEKAPKKESKEEAQKKPEEPPAPVPEPKGDWRVLPWLKEFKDPPVLVKMTLQKAGQAGKVVFMFPLSNGKAHIIYEG